MGPLAIIVALELVVTATILGFSSHPQALNNTKHQISNVLGVKIAQVDDSSDQTSADSNTTSPTPDITTPASTDSTGSTASEANPTSSSDQVNSSSSPAEQTNPESSSSPLETPRLFEQEINPSPTETNQNKPSGGQVEQPPPPSQTSQTGDVTQTQAVLNADDLINSPDNISDQSVQEAKKEDEKISQISDPKQQTLTLITFATDKVKDMSNFTKANDFSSTNFAAQRFNNQIDQAISNLEKLPSKDQVRVKQQLINFCNQADQVLRTVELAVPQESEQDIQMARGQCQELQL